VKQSKKTENQSKGQVKNTDNNWKIKAQSRGLENQSLKKRLKELTASRDLWKSKYQKVSKSDINARLLLGQKAKHHQYSLPIILLTLDFQRFGSMSLRGCRHCLGCLLLSLGLDGRLPSHNSIRNWVCKYGYNRIVECQVQRGSYVLYVDESIVFGSEKILLILGILQSKIPLKNSVNHSDMEVLFVGSSNEWKAESIELELQNIAKNKRISYVVSDEGLNLRKAYDLCNYVHIEDCTHIIANHLKRLYGEDTTFAAFRNLIGKLRQSWNLSKTNSQYMPPGMRGKMRFANIFPCIEWAKTRLDNWESMDEKVRISLGFLKANSAFIEQLVVIGKLFKIVCLKLKTEGFGENQKSSIFSYLSSFTTGEKVIVFVQNIKEYLENLAKKRIELEQEHLLCSSDIIESFFGKYKQKINPNSRNKQTEFMFTIANFSGNITEKELKSALENIKIKDLKQAKQNPKKT
jgi:hypothetical protein